MSTTRYGEYNSLSEAYAALTAKAPLTDPSVAGIEILKTTWGAISYCEIAAQDDPVWVINVLVNEKRADEPLMDKSALGYNPFSEED